MPEPANSTLFDTLTPNQSDVLQALAVRLSVTDAARAGVHLSSVHLWPPPDPQTSTFSCRRLAACQERAEPLADSLAGFTHSPTTLFDRFCAAAKPPLSMEFVKLAQLKNSSNTSAVTQVRAA